MLFSLSVGKEENTAEIRSLECLEVEATVLTPQFPVTDFLRYCIRITYPTSCNLLYKLSPCPSGKLLNLYATWYFRVRMLGDVIRSF